MEETSSIVEDTNDWKQKIFDWLSDEGMFQREVEDSKAAFHFGVNYPVGSPYHIEVVKPRDIQDGILIIAVLRVAPAHRKKLSNLSAEKRKHLFFDLRMRLLQRRPAFRVKDPERDWEAVQFQLRLLYDTLTKTRLLDAIDEVFRSMLIVILMFSHHFGAPSDAQQPGFYT